jgi:hypothetical protein
MNTTANKKIALAALAAPVMAAIGIGLAAPAFAASERVEPSEPSEAAEAGMWSMPGEPQEQAAPAINVALPKPANTVSMGECTTHDVVIHAFC